MRIVLVGVLMSVLACSPPASTGDRASAPQAAAVNNCPAHAASQWSAGAGQTFGIVADAAGASCADVSATITIRDASGAVVYAETVKGADVQSLDGAELIADMERRLGEWITPAGASMDSTDDLAPWAEGAPMPVHADVPFRPAPNVTREIYEALRAGQAPMYCYEQNREGGFCLTVQDGVLEPIGVQTYAG